MPSSLITADGPAKSTQSLSVRTFGWQLRGIFRGLGASAHTMPDSLVAFNTHTLLLQRLYTSEYIISDQNNQCIMHIDTNYYVMLY